MGKERIEPNNTVLHFDVGWCKRAMVKTNIKIEKMHMKFKMCNMNVCFVEAINYSTK